MAAADVDRTCDLSPCAMDPCVVHRRDEDVAIYLEASYGRGLDEPTCGDCGTVTEVVMTVFGHIVPGVARDKYECPECGQLFVVDRHAQQRTLAAFETDGGQQSTTTRHDTRHE